MLRKKNIGIAILISFAYFLIHLILMGDYGISWDYHYHHFAGLFHMGLPVPKVTDSVNIPFTSPDPRLSIEDPFGPFIQIIPSLSQVILHDKLSLLPFDSAYNFPMIIFGALGVGLTYIFISEFESPLAAFFASLFLALYPSYFGYLHNNMKDIPNAFAITLAIYLFVKHNKKRTILSLFWAAVAFAFAFNLKINSVIVSVICFVWISVLYLLKKLKGKKKSILLLYFILSPTAAVALWWPFWRDPLRKLLELPYFFSHNTLNMPVLFMGRFYQSGVNIPWHYPFTYISISTPLTMLMAFAIGILITIYRIKQRNSYSLLYLLWFTLPLGRYLLPRASAIDGVRHFMEITYPLAIISGIGAAWIADRFASLFKKYYLAKVLAILFFVIPLIWDNYHYHPYQTSFFNYIAGGITGARGKFDIDFWGTPQREAVIWINENVPPNSYVNIVMAQSSAAMYLRKDLVSLVNKKDMASSDYTVILNRESFFPSIGLYEYLKQKQDNIVYSEKIDGVPLVWVIKN